MTQERAPRLTRDELDDEQRRLYDAVTGGARSRQADVLPLVDGEGSLEGPFGPMLHAPGIGLLVQALGAGVRSELSVDDRSREIATLWCAAVVRSGYELAAHRRLAARAGLTNGEIDELAAGILPDSITAHEREFALAASRTDWDDETFIHARDRLGLGELVEAITLGGYYRLLATLLDAFNITDIHD